jgi:hypothetical protein
MFPGDRTDRTQNALIVFLGTFNSRDRLSPGTGLHSHPRNCEFDLSDALDTPSAGSSADDPIASILSRTATSPLGLFHSANGNPDRRSPHKRVIDR